VKSIWVSCGTARSKSQQSFVQFHKAPRLPAGLIVLVDDPGPDALQVVGLLHHEVARQGLPPEDLGERPALVGPEQLQGHCQGGGGALAQAVQDLSPPVLLSDAVLKGVHNLLESVLAGKMGRYLGVQPGAGRDIFPGQALE
jgi:hypothetical protein